MVTLRSMFYLIVHFILMIWNDDLVLKNIYDQNNNNEVKHK